MVFCLRKQFWFRITVPCQQDLQDGCDGCSLLDNTVNGIIKYCLSLVFSYSRFAKMISSKILQSNIAWSIKTCMTFHKFCLIIVSTQVSKPLNFIHWVDLNYVRTSNTKLPAKCLRALPLTFHWVRSELMFYRALW